MNIYERLTNLRDKYQGNIDYHIREQILFNLLEIAFHNDDTLPSKLVFTFNYFDNPISSESLERKIYDILQDLQEANMFWVTSKLIKGGKLSITFEHL